MSKPTATFSFPTATIFGPGTLAELPEKLKSLGVLRPLVVTDAGLLATEAFGLLERALAPVGERNKGWFLFSGVRPNPVEEDVVEGARAFREGSCDGVIA